VNKTILAVDDSGSMRRMVSFSLTSAGYDVVEAVDGTDALAKACERRVDLVLTDLNMPGMDGLALVRELRQTPGYERVPILVLTTEGSTDVKVKGRESGANGWLVKPFDPQQLVGVVARLVGDAA
jgi:two-component system, chemotaxis family, chemotaxis protein CheY